MNRQEILDWVRERYGTEPEHLWARYPEYAVLRNRDGKWYGVLMRVPKNKLGLDGGECAEILNVKADPADIDLLTGLNGFCRAYHMNKAQWLTILLDGSVSAAEIKALLAGSYERTSRRRKR